MNSFHKVIPIGQTKTHAVITAKSSEREWLFYLPFSDRPAGDPVFEFVLQFKDENGKNYRMKKEVTRYTFERYKTYDQISISYRKSNPFDIFIRDTTFTDTYQAFTYWEFIICFSITMIAAISGISVGKRLRKKYKKQRN